MARANLTKEEVLAKTILGEARGELREGKEAVGHVINNRAQANKEYWGGSDIKDVCLHRNQFECWNNKHDIGIGINEQSAYKECCEVAEKILNGSSRDPTRGADHYHNPKKEPNPSWVANCTLLGDIENHRFYKSRQ
ncbi:unnamed protein product [Rotaria sp. Silwood1]|nr:unnamed protein product [Rotaria sp. Silwood1]